MAKLEDLYTGTRLTGFAASGSAAVESVRWIGGQVVKIVACTTAADSGSSNSASRVSNTRVSHNDATEHWG